MAEKFLPPPEGQEQQPPGGQQAEQRPLQRLQRRQRAQYTVRTSQQGRGQQTPSAGREPGEPGRTV